MILIILFNILNNTFLKGGENMKLEWNDPSFKDLSVVNTEAANKTNPIHDGTI